MTEFTLPSMEPVPMPGFWLIWRMVGDQLKCYSFESTVPTLDIENHVNGAELVRQFPSIDHPEAINAVAELEESPIKI